MPATSAPPRTKISVSLSDEAALAVDELANRKGIAVSEVIRRAIITLKFVEDEVAAGSTLLLRHPDGETERIQFVFG